MLKLCMVRFSFLILFRIFVFHLCSGIRLVCNFLCQAVTFFFFFGNWGYVSFTEWVGSILLFTLPEKFDNIKMIYSLKKLKTFLQRGFMFTSTEGRRHCPRVLRASSSLSVSVSNQHVYFSAALVFSLFTGHSKVPALVSACCFSLEDSYFNLIFCEH